MEVKPDPNRFIRYPELKANYGIPYSRTHLWRLESVGKFPARIRLSTRCMGWRASEITAWLNQFQTSKPA